MPTDHELATIETGLGDVIHGLRPPEEIIKEATIRAEKLKEVVARTKRSIKIGKSEHLFVEAWITVGSFFGCSGRTDEAEYVEIGGVPGFKARGRCVHDATGQVLSEAISYCMRDEEKWNTRPIYEYKNDQRVKVGEETVPLFQLASMAQTRSLSKAMANKFRWVVVLAGYAATPAEEMTGNEQGHGDQQDEAPRALAFTYGKHKGQSIDDQAVPTGYLEWFADMTAGQIKRPDQAQFKEKNQAMVLALDAEIAKRKAKKEDKPKEPEAKPAKPPMDDAAWNGFIDIAVADYKSTFIEILNTWQVSKPDDIAADKRWQFYNDVNDAVAASEG